MNNPAWLERLETLLARFSYLGIEADIGTMDLTALWGLYQYLLRLEAESDGN